MLAGGSWSAVPAGAALPVPLVAGLGLAELGLAVGLGVTGGEVVGVGLVGPGLGVLAGGELAPVPGQLAVLGLPVGVALGVAPGLDGGVAAGLGQVVALAGADVLGQGPGPSAAGLPVAQAADSER